MEHITNLSGSNMGGVKAVYYTDQNNILTFPFANGLSLIGDIVLRVNCFWYRLFPTTDTCEFKETWKEEFDGLAFYPELKMAKGSNNSGTIQNLWALLGKRLVLIVHYNNGLARIAGDQDYFLKIESESSSGANPRQRPDELLSFKGESTHPAYFYDGALALAEQTLPGTGGSNNGSGSGEPVIFRKTNGDVIAVVQPGGIVEIRSGFRLEFNVLD